jgi:hypothetical protein
MNMRSIGGSPRKRREEAVESQLDSTIGVKVSNAEIHSSLEPY